MRHLTDNSAAPQGTCYHGSAECPPASDHDRRLVRLERAVDEIVGEIVLLSDVSGGSLLDTSRLTAASRRLWVLCRSGIRSSGLP